MNNNQLHLFSEDDKVNEYLSSEAKIYTKESLIKALQDIRDKGWVENARPGNDGGVGNTLEDLLGIKENNLPIPNASEWELKAQRSKTSSLTTLLHIEPSPTAFRFVPAILLPKYGWKHALAGKNYPITEMSFRQTINGVSRTDRGFGILVNRAQRRVEVSFDYKAVAKRHAEWLSFVENGVGLVELNPQPYWGFDDLFHAIGTKLKNCFYVRAQSKRINKVEHFNYSDIMILSNFSLDKFLTAIEQGNILIDFDARTGHNHGTKIRIRQNILPSLYEITQSF